MSITVSWAQAVSVILRSASISQATLGKEVGLIPMTWNRYARGLRRPDEATVRRVNRVTATRVGVPDCAEYLNALAMRDGLLRPKGGDCAVGAVSALMRSFDRYFVNGAQRALIEAFEAAHFDRSRCAWVFVELVALRGQTLLAKLDGRTSREPLIDEVLGLFRGCGAPLDAYLVHDTELQVLRARDRFQALVEIEIADMTKHPATVARIMQHFARTVNDIRSALAPRITTAEDLETFRLALGCAPHSGAGPTKKRARNCPRTAKKAR